MTKEELEKENAELKAFRRDCIKLTDKEMAEKYRKALKQKLIDEDDFERLEMFDENVQEAYLAGLKAFRRDCIKLTDKEMAEKYRKALKQKLIDEDDFERLEMFDENVQEAYLAGLKAGREIEKEYVKNNAFTSMKEQGLFPYSNCPNIEKKLKQAYLAGAESREKRIAELEAQIEKMKCCENCADYDGQDCDADNENYCRCFTGDKNNDCYWRLKDN